MNKRPHSLPPDGLEAVRNYLEDYQTCKSMIEMTQVLDQETETYGDRDDGLSEQTFWRAKMFQVRMMVNHVSNSDEKRFLYFHYLKGLSVEKSAELMNISPRTAFRLKKRALQNLLPHFEKSRTA